ncbi:diphosphomevalonate decarboxylase [Sporosarcina jiandibaonis]|uniref:diphosphomevalonate decarboxylase n=1 Tax=Sporosarcina jiandibaonis TaxID=2715535 RepID=UPI00155551D8|nr:diphosphomevalonate decarboxylase [Sporosarcina jiandibaonis]
MEATAKAHTNIALIKYWGKRDEELFLPMNNSLSITLDQFYTITSVQFCECLTADKFYLNETLATDDETKKISELLDLIRKLSGVKMFAVVDSLNKVPTAAGFASSASGFAALAAAATKAIGMDIDEQTLSTIARRGSGSACRSIYGGYVEWQKGELLDGTDSYAEQVLHEKEWDLTILSVLLEPKEKKILSREGMRRSVETSPFYQGWLETVDEDLEVAKQAINERNFEMLGEVLERNAMKMHATTLGANPPFMYWQSATFDVMEKVQELRESGFRAYFTIDAGPNVKVLCQPKDEEYVRGALMALTPVQDVYTCHPGPGISYLPHTKRKTCC